MLLLPIGPAVAPLLARRARLPISLVVEGGGCDKVVRLGSLHGLLLRRVLLRRREQPVVLFRLRQRIEAGKSEPCQVRMGCSCPAPLQRTALSQVLATTSARRQLGGTTHAHCTDARRPSTL